MERAESEHPAGPELRLMLYAAGELGLHKRAAEYARLALQETPYDRELLHIRAVALLRGGEAVSEALRCWERILRIDPEDSIAAYYCEAAESGAFEPEALDYAYQVPDGEYARRVTALGEHLNRGFEHIREQWEANPAFRRLIRWAVTAEDERLGRASMTVLSTLETPEAVSALRESMFDPGTPRNLKLHATLLMKLQGRELEQIIPEPMSSSGDMLVDTDALIDLMPVGERQLVRYTAEVLEREYDITAMSALTLMWLSYRRLRGTRGDPLKRIEAAAAGLACNYLLASGNRPNIGELARAFGCTPRQLTFCAARIADCLERAGH